MTTLPEGSDHPINGYSIFTLIVFFVVNFLVVFPLHIPIPRPVSRFLAQVAVSCRIISPHGAAEHIPSADNTVDDGPSTSRADDSASQWSSHSTSRHRLPLGLTTAPVIGVLLLLASTSIPGHVIREGIVGSEGVRPYDIMTLFISLAYISISLDCTGLLRFLAFWVALKGGSSGRKLYLYFYLFSFGFGSLVGNDPIILSGTSFLAYFTRIAGISPPRAWIFAQLTACNVASAVLVSSNPTNLVLTGAYSINFLTYSAWLVLPVLATAVVLFPWLLWGQFDNSDLIPRKLVQPDVDPKSALIDRPGAIFGSVLLGATLVALVALSAVGLLEGVQGVWTVTAPAALVMLGRDIWYDYHKSRRRHKPSPAPREQGPDSGDQEQSGRPEIETQGRDDLAGRDGVMEVGESVEMKPIETGGESDIGEGRLQTEAARPRAARRRTGTSHTSDTPRISLDVNDSATTVGGSPMAPSTPTAQLLQNPPTRKTLGTIFHDLSLRVPTVSYIFARLPLPLLPFAFSMFILVEALQWVGWIRVFAGWWTAWVQVSGLPGAMWLMACLSILGCNVFGTNIGATILLSRVLQQWNATTTATPRILYGSLYTLALGSNYGAFSYTFSASLAGLLWKDILLQKGIQVGRWEFAKNNLVTVLICMVVGTLVIAGEVCVIYK